MKRIIALALTLILALTVLAGCGEKKAEAIPKLAADPVNSGTQNQAAADPANTGAETASIAAVSISSAKNSAKKTIVVKWKKSAQAAGYEIQYAASKNFKGKKTLKVKKAAAASAKIKKLKKKTYFIRIRAYAATGGKTVYSDWSKVKKVKVKK